MDQPPSDDPFSSRHRAPRITPWTLLTFVFSVPVRAPWLSLPAGLAIAWFLRTYRGQSGFLAALAFAGIPLAIYGAVAGFVQWRWF